MQSWGEKSLWDVRDTGTEPTKSGIIGLLGCALGYSNERLPELNKSLRMGVRVNNSGHIEKDYQTISGYFYTADKEWKYLDNGVSRIGKNLDKILDNPNSTPYTLISPRYYIMDASFLVGLESDNPEIILACARALKYPKWPLFLGRKSCVPSRPIFESLEDSFYSLEEALTTYRTASHIQEMYIKKVIIDDINGDIIKNDNIEGYYKTLIYGERRVRSLSYV